MTYLEAQRWTGMFQSVQNCMMFSAFLKQNINSHNYMKETNTDIYLIFEKMVLSFRNMYVIINDGERNWVGFHNRLMIY